MKNKSCIIDASSAILLHKAGLFEKTIESYISYITESVFHEITRVGYYGSLDFITYYQQNKFIVKKPVSITNDVLKFGLGERDTISLYFELLELHADLFVVIDDGKAATYCQKMSIPYINALLVPKILYYSDTLFINEVETCLQNIISHGRYSMDVINFVLNCTEDDVKYFLQKQ